MEKEILPLACEFIGIRSDPDNQPALEEILELALSHLQDYSIERFERNGVKSALIHNQPKRPSRFKVLLNGHLDVIPAKADQYSARIEGSKLYGAGSMDMKSNVSCLIAAFKSVANSVNYPLGLQLVTDEETGGFNGTKLQVDEGVRADFIIAGESTNFNIVNKAKGVFLAKISSSGETAHGAYPWRGTNAIWEMVEFLNALKERYPIPTKEVIGTTVNLARIKTKNEVYNKIPDDCDIFLDVRHLQEDADTVVASIEDLLPAGFTLSIEAKEPGLSVSENNPNIESIRRVTEKCINRTITCYMANGTSDARHFTRVGCDGIEFGPTGGGIGTDNEWVDIPSLFTFHNILKEYLYSIG